MNIESISAIATDVLGSTEIAKTSASSVSGPSFADYINQYYQLCFSDEQLRQFSSRLNIAATSSKALGKLHLAQFAK